MIMNVYHPVFSGFYGGLIGITYLHDLSGNVYRWEDGSGSGDFIQYIT